VTWYEQHMNLPIQVLTAAVPSDPVLRADGAAVACVITRGDLTADRWDRCIRVDEHESSGPADRHPRWSPVGDDLLFIRPDAKGVDQVVRWPTGDAITAVAASVRQFAWSADGGSIAVVVAVRTDGDGPHVTNVATYLRDGEGRTPSAAALIVVDLASGATREVLPPTLSIGDIAWRDAQTLLVTLPHGDGSWRWDLAAVTLDGVVNVLTDHGPWDRAARPVALDDESVLFAGGASGPAHTELRRWDAGVTTRLVPGLDRNVTIGMPAYPGASPAIDGDTVWFTANDRGASRLCSAALDASEPVVHTDVRAVVTGADARAGNVLLTEATTNSPGRLRLLEDHTGLGDEVDVPWSVEELDGDTPCWLLRSRRTGADPAPLLVDLHGGPHNASNGALWQGNLHRLLLAAAGWHLLLPNFRGSDGYGSTWYRGLEAHGGWCSIDVADVMGAVDTAVASGVADETRLAVAGYSYGGLLAAALTTVSDRFCAAALGGAPVDLRAFSESSDLGLVLCEREVGERVAADRRSPIHEVAKVRTPTLVYHGAEDRRVPVSQADQWYQGLAHAGAECELVVYPGMPHGFVSSGPPNTVLDLGARIADWLLRWTTP
jgi:dipeptidyl aminopeptidase/acylaminoacyl peptidase